jgi:hypothetical protein
MSEFRPHHDQHNLRPYYRDQAGPADPVCPSLYFLTCGTRSLGLKRKLKISGKQVPGGISIPMWFRLSGGLSSLAEKVIFYENNGRDHAAH